MKTDLSDEAITARLNQVEQLRRLCLSLGKAKLIEKKVAHPPITERIESTEYGDNLRRTNK